MPGEVPSEAPWSSDEIELGPPYSRELPPPIEAAPSAPVPEPPAEAPAEALPPMTMDELLSDPHVWSLYRDEGYLLAYTSQTPISQLGDLGVDVEDFSKQALNIWTMSQLWGSSVEDAESVMPAYVFGFAHNEFGRQPKDHGRDLYAMISREAAKRDATMLARLCEAGEEEDDFDEEEWDRQADENFRNKYPVLSRMLRVIHGAASSVIDPMRADTSEAGKRSLAETLGALAELNTDSFNTAQTFAYDDGNGRLAVNWEGIGAFGASLAMGRVVSRMGKWSTARPRRNKDAPVERPKAMEEIRLGPKGPMRKVGEVSDTTGVRPISEKPTGITYDGETKQTLHGDRVLTPDEAVEVSRRLQEEELSAKQSGANEPVAKGEGPIAEKSGFIRAGYHKFDNAAENAYDLIRGNRSDGIQIARNLGLDAKSVNTMKKHLFYGRHHIATGPGQTVFRRFSADVDIAAHWQGASAGTLSQRQKAWFRQLMEHELGERAFMGKGIPFRSPDPRVWRVLHPSIGPVNVNVPGVSQAHFMAPPQP